VSPFRAHFALETVSDFRLILYWIRLRSGAAKQFTAAAEEIKISLPSPPPSPAPTIGGGGGGGIGISPPSQLPASTFLDYIWQKIIDIFSFLFSNSKRIADLENRIANLEKAVSKPPVPAPKPLPKEVLKISEKLPKPVKIKLKIRVE
jgi:hypothetical protein